MAISKIKTGSINSDAITEAKVADGAIENEHLNNNVILGQTELAEAASSNDILLVYDVSSGTLKKILASNVGTQAVTLSSVSPTNALSGDGIGNYTFTITGTNLTGASAVLITSSGTEVNFDSVTIDSSTQITAVIAKASITNANEPYDVKVYGSNGLTAILRDQINVDASPIFVTASGSLGSQTIATAGSFSVNATDPESAGNVTFELQSGSLPPGYSITNTAANGGTAIISGTDSTTSSTTTFNFVLRAVDAASNTSSRSFSIQSRVLITESFTSSGTFSVPSGITSADVLVVAGGGGAGIDHGGGGGAGGLIFVPGFPVTPGGTVSVTVGCGGAGGQNCDPSPFPSNTGKHGIPGQDSVFGTLTAKGGGGGGGGPIGQIQHSEKVTGQPGGSAGGSGGHSNGSGTTRPAYGASQPTQPGQSGAYGFGGDGGIAYYPLASRLYSGGGGGAGANGNPGIAAAPLEGKGGDGRAYTIADGTTPVYYAGGGGGTHYCGAYTPGKGQGGQGGGGQSASNIPGGTHSGGANKGGGGGGGSGPGGTGGVGGKGIVIVRY